MKLRKCLSIMLSILSNILIVVAVILLMLNLFFMFNSKTKKNFVPDIFGYKFLIDMSDSMKPTINAFDLVIIKEKDNYDVLDIVCYRDKDDVLITHRIIDTQEKDGKILFKTKGDNNSTQDSELISKESIEGSLVTNINGVGKFILFLTTPIGILVFILFIVVLFLSEYLISKIRSDTN